MVVHTCNPYYTGGRDGTTVVQANQATVEDPICKTN
jgi:hypothetical protein